MITNLLFEIEQFKKWASSVPEEKQFAEWECDYIGWDKIYNEFENLENLYAFLQNNEDEIQNIIYIIARDNEAEWISGKIAEHEELLLFLSARSLNFGESDTKWQLAINLEFCKNYEESEHLLELFVKDKDEYVNRRALMTMARIGAENTEKYCKIAWDRDIYGDLQEYQRIAVLQSLYDIRSPLLDDYILLAKKDGRKYLVQNAERLLERLN